MNGEAGRQEPARNGRSGPDPSTLTTEQLHREIAAVREVIESAMDGMMLLIDEKFRAVAEQLALVERQRVEQKQDTKAAVDAALCVSADTPILCADLVWRPAGDLLVGDELIAVDEVGDGAPGGGRRFRRATVTANRLERAPLLRVNTTAGHLRCTYDHPLLAGKSYGGQAQRWVKAENLSPNDLLPYPFPMWDVDRSYEAGWLAGILDGEGCLTFKSCRDGAGRLTMGQVPGELADAIGAAMKSRVGLMTTAIRQPNRTGRSGSSVQPQVRWSVDGRADIMRLLGSVRPLRLLATADGLWEGRTTRVRGRGAQVTSVEGCGTGMVASLTTTTRTYIAGGYISHNTAQKEAVKEQTTASATAIAKSEAGTSEQLKQLGSNFTIANRGLQDMLSDLKDRVGKMEAVKLGGQESIADRQRVSTGLYALVGVVFTFMLIVVAIAALLVAR